MCSEMGDRGVVALLATVDAPIFLYRCSCQFTFPLRFANMSVNTCGKCGEEGTECPCSTFTVRVWGMKKELATSGKCEVDDAWANLSKEQRQEFDRTHHDKVRKEFATAIEESAEQIRSERMSRTARGVGKMTDKIDLDKKYEDEPDQLKSRCEKSVQRAL